MVPAPVPVLSSVGSTIEAVSAFSNAAMGAGARASRAFRSSVGAPGPDSVALVRAVATVWVSVRSVSVNANVPEVALGEISGPPVVLVPAVNAMCWTSWSVVMTGASLVPVIAIVKD